MLHRLQAPPAPALAAGLPPRLSAAGLAGLAAVAAVAFGAMLPANPPGALSLVVAVPLVFVAPVASLGVLLFITMLVPFDTQNELAIVGGVDTPGLLLIDVVLLLGLCRVALLLWSGRLRLNSPLRLAGLVGLVLSAALLVGLANGADLSQAGHEARRVVLIVGGFLLAWPILEDPRARRRLYGVLLLLGVAGGVWGLLQWLLDIPLVEASDIGVRAGVAGTEEAAARLQGGLWGYPVAITLSLAALLSFRVRSGEARWLLVGILALNAVCLVLTYERTFWAGTVLACVVVALRSGPQARRAFVKWAPFAAVALIAALAALGQLGTTMERVISVAGYGSEQSFEHRRVETEHVFDAIAERPLTGSGFGATITWGKEGVFQTQTTPFSHNGYFWLAWKLGIPAAAFFVLLIVLVALRRGPPPDDEWLGVLRVASQATLIGLLVIGVTFPPFNAPGVTAVIGLLLAASLQPWRSPARAHGRTRDPTPG